MNKKYGFAHFRGATERLIHGVKPANLSQEHIRIPPRMDNKIEDNGRDGYHNHKVIYLFCV